MPRQSGTLATARSRSHSIISPELRCCDGCLHHGRRSRRVRAIAFYFVGHQHGVSVDDIPIAGGQVDPVALTALIRNFAPSVAMVELVHSMPKQGVASSFNF